MQFCVVLHNRDMRLTFIMKYGKKVFSIISILLFFTACTSRHEEMLQRLDELDAMGDRYARYTSLYYKEPLLLRGLCGQAPPRVRERMNF